MASNILSAYRPNPMWGNCDSVTTSCLASYYLSTDLCDVEICTLATSLTVFWLNLQLGLYDQFMMMREMKCCLLVWAFTTCLQAFAGYWGRCMLFSFSGSILPAFRPCWMSGETSSVSLSGPLLPARGAYCRKLREIYAVLLVCVLFSLSGSGPLLPAFRPSQDAGGDVCCSPRLPSLCQLTSLHNGFLVEVLFKTVWYQIQLSFLVPRIRLDELILNGSSSVQVCRKNSDCY